MLKPEDHDKFIANVSSMLKKVIATKRMKLFGHVRWGASKVSIVSIEGECNDQNIAIVVACYSIDGKFYFHHTDVSDWVDLEAILSQSDFDEWINDFDSDDIPFGEASELTEIYASLDKAITTWNSQINSANWT